MASCLHTHTILKAGSRAQLAQVLVTTRAAVTRLAFRTFDHSIVTLAEMFTTLSTVIKFLQHRVCSE